MNRQYVGARYVPKFADPIEWDNTRSYEALEIVTHLGTSYTSKKPVPVGTNISNQDYWVATGNYNAQVEQYRQLVIGYANKVDIGYKNIREYGAIGDGVTDDKTAFLNCANDCVTSGCGMVIPEDMSIYVSSGAVVNGVRNVKCLGTIVAPDGVEFDVDARNINLNWYFKNVTGKLILSGMKSGIVTIQSCDELYIYADSTVAAKYSVAYNQFYLGEIKKFTLEGINSGWINENIFTGGRFEEFYIIGGTYPHNNNHWYMPTLENGAKIDVNHAHNNYWHNVRAEGITSADFRENAFYNFFEISYWDERIEIYKTPTWWHDQTGRNFVYCSATPALRRYEKVYTPGSMNYENAANLYPSGGLLHNNSFNSTFLETALIPIDKVIQIFCKSDATFFRAYLRCYDENKEQITTEPSVSPITGTATWVSSSNCYGLASANQNIIEWCISRYSRNGTDSGVRYVKLTINGYGSTNFEKFIAKISTAYLNDIGSPFKPNKLYSTSVPASSVEYPRGEIIYCTDSSNSTVLGWTWTSGGWKTISI